MTLMTISVFIVIAVILSVLWLADREDRLRGDLDDLFSLRQVEDGIQCTILLDTQSSWEYYTVCINQGQSSASWDFRSTNLSTGIPVVEDCGNQSLGGIILRLHVFDIQGDDMPGRGDSIIVTTSDSTEFLSDTIYSLAVTHGQLYISGAQWRMSFWFDDDQLVTGPMVTIVVPA
jgi:hypothetical protein